MSTQLKLFEKFFRRNSLKAGGLCTLRQKYRVFCKFLFEYMYSLGYTLTMASEVRLNQVKKMIEKKGYELTRISSSHHIFTKKGWSPVSVPVHKGKVKAFYVKQIEKIE